MTSPAASSTESGCVGGGAGGSTVTGASKCPGSGPTGNAFTGGDEQAINNAPTAASLGLTDFEDLRILFNASEPAGNSIQLDNLALTLWDTDGTILGAFYIPDEVPFASTNPGVGNSGFFFALDAAQAANANLLLAANPDLLIGLAANASDATGGLETFSVGAVGGTAVPEQTTITLLGLSLVGLHLVTRKRARR